MSSARGTRGDFQEKKVIELRRHHYPLARVSRCRAAGFVLVILLALLVPRELIGGPLSGSIIFEDGFEDVEAMEYPRDQDWMNLAAGEETKAYVSTIESYSGEKSLRLEGLPDEERVDCVSISPGDGRLTYEIAVYVAEANKGATIGFAEHIKDKVLFFNAMRFGNDGYVYFEGKREEPKKLWPYSAKIWYRIKVEIDFANQTAKVYLDDQKESGELEAYSASFNHGDLGITLDKFALGTNSFADQGPAVIYFDDVEIRKVLPEDLVLLEEANAKLGDADRLATIHPLFGYITGKHKKALELAEKAATLYARIGAEEGTEKAQSLISQIKESLSQGFKAVLFIGLLLLLTPPLVWGIRKLHRRRRLKPRHALQAMGGGGEALLNVIPTGDRSLVRLVIPAPHPRVLSEDIAIPEDFRQSLLRSYGELAEWGSNFGLAQRGSRIAEIGLESPEETYTRFRQLGQDLYSRCLPPQVRAHLTAMLAYAQGPLKIMAEKQEANLPWELLFIQEEGDFLCLLLPISRTLMAASHPSTLQIDEVLVVAADPEAVLPEALEEGKLLYEVLKRSGIQVKKLLGEEASKENFLHELQSGRFQALHYSGHSEYVDEAPDMSFLLLGDGRQVTAHELNRLAKEKRSGLQLVFLNSCASASGWDPFSAMLGLVEAFVRNGIPYVIGMRWEISDVGAERLATSFYEEIKQSGDVVNTLRLARQAVGGATDWRDPAWASPVLYTF